MTNKTFTPVLLGAGTLLLVGALYLGYSNTTNNKNNSTTNTSISNKNKEDVTYSYKNIKNSTFYVTKDKKVVTEVPKDSLIVDWYMDPFCPACNVLETLVSEETEAIYQDNVYIRYHVLSFLDAETRVDGNEFGYSTTASGYILGAVEFAPEIAVNYLNEIVNINFRPDNGKKTETEFKQAFTKVGGTEEQWTKIKAVHTDLMKQNKNDTNLAFNSKELKSRSSSGEIYVPFILIGEDSKSLDFESSTDSVKYIKSEIEKKKTELEEKLKSEQK